MGRVQGVAVDSAGNVYATDQTNNVVVRISPAGIIAVVAGNNIAGFSGDGGPATNASLNLVADVEVDAQGNLYIADRNNQRIRKVSPGGIITTVAGNGNSGFSGDGGPATSAGLTYPTGVAVDVAGNLYIADGGAHRIRKVDTNGIITTFAGSGVAGFSGDGGPATIAALRNPSDMAVDSLGTLYISDSANHRIRKVTPDGTITTVAGNGATPLPGGVASDGGPATNASLNSPSGVAVDAAGNFYFVEPPISRIRKVSRDGILSTVAGGGRASPSLGDGGSATAAALGGPRDVAVLGGNLYIADTGNGRVRRVGPDGIITTIAGTGLGNFSGDGGPATGALLSQPVGVAVDPSGTLYIADSFNNRIRKVAPDGRITTLAGNGIAEVSGDGGPATSASLQEPFGLAVDLAGNVYVTGSHRIRKISPAGIITTIAGAGAGFSGDGGPATSAMLRNANDVALDAFGNIFISDWLNYRIRKVSPAGIITTVAGNGIQGFSGDGGPAVNASLNDPQGIAVDAAGNLYIAEGGPNGRIRKVTLDGMISTIAGGGPFGQDGVPATSVLLGPLGRVAVDSVGNLYISESFGGHRIRKVSADGIITTVVGVRVAGFSGDGGPATAAQLNAPWGVAVDQSGNLYIADSLNDRIRKVLAGAPSFAVAPGSLNFTAQAGAGEVAPQRITLTGSIIGLSWSAEVATESGGNWLSASPAAGTMPSVVDVKVDAANLTPGTYQGAVTIQAPLALPPAQTIAVRLTVEAALPAKLAVEPSALTFETLAGGNLPARTLRVSNAGGGSLDWTARTETTAGGNWLSVSPSSGSVSAGGSNQVQVLVNSSTLVAGVYSGAVVVGSATTSETLRVPVSLLVSQSKQTILVSQSGLLFTGVEGVGVIPSQSFGVLNSGEGVMSWTAQASTLAGGNWLTVLPREGASDAASLRVPLVEAGVNVSGLRAGAYSGQIRISATGANNSPQFVTVILNVLPGGSNPGVLLRPTGLIFAAQAGTSSPGSQVVSLAAVTPGNVEAVSGLLTRDGGSWLEAVPRNLTLSAVDPIQRIVVQPTLGSLTPGVYRGALTLLFSDSSPPQVVSILFLVVGGTATASLARDSESGLPSPQANGGCVPTQLHATHRTLGTNFGSPVGWPSTIEAQVADNCGNAVPNATVVARFSNGDPLVVLTSLRNGLYVGTWRPSNPAGQAVVTLRAELPPLTPVEAQAQGQVNANAASPALLAGGIVNGASFVRGEALAPGSLISVFGRNLAQGENHASQSPLEKTLGGATLNIGGIEAPLIFAGAGQINAQVPFELAPNTRPQVVVKTLAGAGSQTFTVPETITLATVRPGIFTTNEQGTGQGIIQNQDYSPNAASNPAARGSVVQIYATGLGVTNPSVPSGQLAPSTEPLARAVISVEAQVGGRSATVQFAGLAPGWVGLYQVNVEIPAEAQPGPEVPLVLLQNGVPSNTVTLAIR